MPELDGKKYSYDSQGKEDYKKALKKKKKKKKLKKVNIAKSDRQLAGQVMATLVAQNEANKGKSKKERAKIIAKMAVGSLATEYVIKGGKKIYNKVVDKVNKKRGYKK